MTQALLPRSLTVGREPEATSLARRFVADCCESYSAAAVVDDAVLIADELVTNALRHASPAGATVTLWVGRRPHTLVLQVEDASPVPAQPVGPLPLDEDGRGLRLVAGLADRWGNTQVEGGKRVWAEVEVPLG